jgi:hypothetical protein
MMIRSVLVNGSRDTIVPICILWFGMYMLVEESELTPFNVDRICAENRYEVCVGVNWNCAAVVC